MKKLLKQLICFILILCIGAGCVVLRKGDFSTIAQAYEGVCGDDAEWSFDSGILTISGTGTTGNYQVVSGTKAPWYNYKEEILYVEIGEGITSVGTGTFQDCGNILSVSLPESLKEICETSFSGCNKLQTLYIPANVENINASAFLECTVLESVTVDSQNQYYSDTDGILFSKDKTKLVFFPKGKITTEYSVPDGVTEIGEYAFANCSELINISIPSSVNTIGINAFYNCRTLLSADIPEGVTSIKSNTFYGCSALCEVKLPSTITAIGSNAFGKCGSLMKINVPNATKSIDASAFSTSPNLKIYCDKDSEAHKFCVANSIDFYYSNIASLYPVASWNYGNVPHSGQRYARIDVKCTWEEAKLVCEMLGGHLATVTSTEEMTTIQGLVSSGTPDSYWLGASDTETEGTWEWVTGEEFSYSLWASGQPDDCGEVEDYLEAWGKGSSWNDNNLYGTSTELSRGFVCEFENFYIPSKTAVYNGNTYYLFDELLSWNTAKKVCENIGGHLATITSSGEQKVISELCYGSFYPAYWLGATDVSSEGTWEWITGEKFSYSKWNDGEPNNYDGTENYLEMYVPTDGWNDYIDGGYRGFICEIETQANLPANHGYYNGNCYEIYNNNVSWIDAQRIAQSKGGHLVTVTDGDEAAYLHTLYKDLTLADDYLFTGGFRYKHETEYRWVTGERYSYSNWNSGEPNNNSGVENLIQIYRYSNGWNDIGNKGSGYDGNVFIVEYESPKQVLTLCDSDGTVLNRYKVQGGMSVDKPLKDYRPGYTAEWYKDSSLQNRWNFETDMITEDTVLYAYWVPDEVGVNFDACNGDCDINFKTVTYGTVYGELPVCSRNGYVFKGWFADYNCTQEVNADTVVTVSENHTLYAGWQAETYTVSFDGNGGESEILSKTVIFGEPYGELPECSVTGVDFLGWYSDEECTEQISADSTVDFAGDHTLYAGWNESVVTKLQLNSKPTKLDYYVGESLDTSGLIVTATFENGTAGTVPADRFEFSLTSFDTAGKKIIKASYGGKYVSFIVNVSNRVLDSVSISELSDKLVYTVGDVIDTEGLVLKAVYDNSSEKTVTEGFAVSCDLSSAGTQNVIVEYTENGVTVSTSYEVTVNSEVIEPDIIISAASVFVSAGETVSIPFEIEDNSGFTGFAITVDYDSDAFTPVSVTPGTMLANGTLNDSIGSAYEYLKIVYVGSSDVLEDGELFTVDFIVSENAIGDYEFVVSYLQPDTFNESLEDVVLVCEDFDISVSNTVIEQSVFIGGSVDATAGTVVSVPIYVENGIGINSFSFRMTYNSDVMTVVSASNGYILTDGNIDITIDETIGECLLKWSGSPVTADGVLFYAVFEIDEYVQSYEMLSLLCESISFDDESTKNIVCSDIKMNIYNPDADEPAVLYSDEIVINRNSEFEVPIYIRNNHGIMGFGLVFEYDSSMITPVEVEAGDIISAGNFADNIGSNADNFRVLWNNTENVSDNGLLLTVKFSVCEGVVPETVPLSISYNQIDTYNENWDDVELAVDEMTILIKHIYTATFMYSGEVIGTDEFMVDDVSLDYPEIETREHYNWVWDEHDISANNITVNGDYVPIKYKISFYCQNKLVETRSYTIESAVSQILIPEIPKVNGYAVEWPEIELDYRDQSVHAICTPIVYTAQFIADGIVVDTQTFTVETEKLNEPEIPQKAGYIAAWSGYVIKAGNMIIQAKYYLPEVVMKAKLTMKVDETTRLLTSCNFDVTRKIWSSSNPDVAVVDSHGNVTAVGEGECEITVTCYGKDSFGNEIKATAKTEITVKEQLSAETLKERFRAAFDEFFQVKLHDIMYNFREFMILLFRYAY